MKMEREANESAQKVPRRAWLLFFCSEKQSTENDANATFRNSSTSCSRVGFCYEKKLHLEMNPPRRVILETFPALFQFAVENDLNKSELT